MQQIITSANDFRNERIVCIDIMSHGKELLNVKCVANAHLIVFHLVQERTSRTDKSRVNKLLALVVSGYKQIHGWLYEPFEHFIGQVDVLFSRRRRLQLVVHCPN